MSGYVIFDVGPFDRSAMATYLEKVFDMIAVHGGKFIARTDNIEVRESTHRGGIRRAFLSSNFPASTPPRAGMTPPNIRRSCRSGWRMAKTTW